MMLRKLRDSGLTSRLLDFSTFRGESCGENPDQQLQKSKTFSIMNFKNVDKFDKYIENIKNPNLR